MSAEILLWMAIGAFMAWSLNRLFTEPGVKP